MIQIDKPCRKCS